MPLTILKMFTPMTNFHSSGASFGESCRDAKADAESSAYHEWVLPYMSIGRNRFMLFDDQPGTPWALAESRAKEAVERSVLHIVVHARNDAPGSELVALARSCSVPAALRCRSWGQAGGAD
jgi:hypothetical protein